MPLDNTKASAALLDDQADRKSIDPLERLGIKPVPFSYVRQYKAQYRKAFRKSHPFNRHAKWMPNVAVSMHDLEGYWGAPKQVIDLAKRVQQEIPEATFSLEWFYLDPVLHVEYDFDGQHQSPCLSIWDEGVVKAIAGDPPRMEELLKPWWRRIFG